MGRRVGATEGAASIARGGAEGGVAGGRGGRDSDGMPRDGPKEALRVHVTKQAMTHVDAGERRGQYEQ